ncbi:MAG: hypothetical protein KatS3mg008_2098 [Acidimicrobiales bacterium]|nr:MAG: hypothetical protein KatS3mg008_2098 [Acidimicrobiales bacterium]
MQLPRVGVVILACADMPLDEPEPLGRVLRSLARQTYAPTATAVVITEGPGEQAALVERELSSGNCVPVPAGSDPSSAAMAGVGAVGEVEYLLFVSSDVELADDAVAELVEEAVRSNAGVVSPKLLAGEEVRTLLSVGYGSDRLGAPSPLVEPGEVDQRQHDVVRDVFAVDHAVFMVRADLFAAVGGFVPQTPLVWVAVDLCWRSHVAGARVLVVPAAVGRCTTVRDHRVDAARVTAARVASRLVCAERLGIAAAVASEVVLGLLVACVSLLRGNPTRARDVFRAWRIVTGLRPQIRAARKTLAAVRVVSSRDALRVAPRPGRSYVPFEAGTTAAGARAIGSSTDKSSYLVGAAVAAFLVLGGRHLLTRGVPDFGSIPRLPEEGSRLLEIWFAGWNSSGLGSTFPRSPAVLLLGLADLFLPLGSGMPRTLLVYGCVPVGLAGAWRLVGASRGARLAALIAYGAAPVAWDALSAGRWEPLCLYAAAPWLVGSLVRAARSEPAGASIQVAARPTLRPGVSTALGVGIVLALVGSVAPYALVAAIVAGAALVAGGVAAGGPHSGARPLAVAVGASSVAWVLLLPWSAHWFGDWDRMIGTLHTIVGDLDWSEIVRLGDGPVATASTSWFLPVSAFCGLLAGGSRCWDAVARGWTLALVFLALTWFSSQGWLPAPAPEPASLLVFAAVGYAMAVGGAVVALRAELRGRSYGLRHLLVGVGAVSLLLSATPVVAATVVDGGWNTPSRDFDEVLAVLDEDGRGSAGAQRVLWLGDPGLVGQAQWRSGRIAFGIYESPMPTIEARWAGEKSGQVAVLERVLRETMAGERLRLGAALGEVGVRYVVVPIRPAIGHGRESRVGEAIREVLDAQLDLRRLDLVPDLAAYENVAWVPVHAERELAEDGTPVGPFRAVPVERVAGARWRLGVSARSMVRVAQTFDPDWEVRGPEGAARVERAGWAMRFRAARPGEYELSRRRSILATSEGLLPLLTWPGAVVGWLFARRRVKVEGSETGVGVR